jgi:hypothetical protein
MKLNSFIGFVYILLLIIGIYLLFTDKVKGRAKIILIVFVLVIGIVLFVNLPMFKSYSELVDKPSSAKQSYVIPATDLKKSDFGKYSMSMWIYVDDWNYRYSQKKVVFQRETPGSSYNPRVYLDEYQNDLHIELNLFNNEDNYASNYGNKIKEAVSGSGTLTYDDVSCNDGKNVECKDGMLYCSTDDSQITIDGNTITGCESSSMEKILIKNINLQKWVNITMVFNDNSVDVYINGKLVKTQVFQGVIDTSSFNSGNVEITPDGGFAGYLSRFYYYNRVITPQEAWNIYKSGFSSNMFGNLLEKYNMAFTFYEDNNEKAKFYIM